MKRILIFSPDDFIPPAGGAEIAIGEITKRLPNFQFDFFCARLNRNKSRYEKINNVNIYRIGFGIPKIDKYLLTLRGCRKALKMHKKTPYDLIWAVMASYGALAAVRFKKKTGVPYLLTLQEGDALEDVENKAKLAVNYFREIFVRADGLQAISKFLYNWGLKMGFRGRVAKVVPNGVDIGNFNCQLKREEVAKIRKSFGFKEDSLILVTVSRLERKNGIGDVVNALNLLPEKVCFVVCGFGSLEADLRKQTRELGLENRVRFLGMITHNNLPKILKASDVFIRPSLSEGLGNAFLEAMAAGIPVIGTPVGGIPDFLEERITGFICQPNNPRNIAAAVQKIMSLERREIERIKLNALNMVREKYSWDVVSKSMNEIFNQLFVPHGVRPPRGV